MVSKVIATVVGLLVALGGTAVWAQNAPQPVTTPALAGFQYGALSAQGQANQTQAANPCEAYEQALAQRLGVSVDKLRSAQKDAAKDMVDQAVKDGKLTADQAAKAKQHIDTAQKCKFPLGRVGGLKPQGQPGKPDLHAFGGASLHVGVDAAAKALGMTSDQLQAQLKSGKTLEQIAKDKGVDLQAVRSAVISAEKAQIDQAVKDGKLTQTQADHLKSTIDKAGSRLFDMLSHHRLSHP
ncbi:MAG: DUF2680 domain-containing protein [Chloroflexi bacterium]|nr:DUF2680 domain-containing protein [Chloroflexota bacterium]MBI3733302.1 DUF2680 domain-containing protein [Chloroflexota bacterium]